MRIKKSLLLMHLQYILTVEYFAIYIIPIESIARFNLQEDKL